MSDPRTPSRRPLARAIAPVVLGALALGGCSTAARTAPVAPTVALLPAGAHVVHPKDTPTSTPTCADPTWSIAPPAVMPRPGAMPSGSYMAKIQTRGYLVAGVDQNTYLWGYRDPTTGLYTGFDIDMLRQVSQSIFGSPDDIHFVVVPTADRQEAVATGEVDIVAETMTINCARETEGPYAVDFSSVYYLAGQEILVPGNSSITGPDDLAGKRVCATDGSTSLTNLVGLHLDPPPVLWSVPDDTDCLVMLQQGEVDAISTDNVILQGLQAQDPNTRLVGPAFTSEPYGMAIAKSHPEFTAFVNGVLASERSDGTWIAIYDRWLAPFTSGAVPSPPAAQYRGAS